MSFLEPFSVKEAFWENAVFNEMQPLNISGQINSAFLLERGIGGLQGLICTVGYMGWFYPKVTFLCFQYTSKKEGRVGKLIILVYLNVHYKKEGSHKFNI